MAEVLLRTPGVAGKNEPLTNPIIKPYYRDGFGSKSIGEPHWRPHPRNALSVPGRLDNTAKGGDGLDWTSSIRCAPLEETTQTTHRPHEKATPYHSLKNNNKAKARDLQEAAQAYHTDSIEEEKPCCGKPTVVYDTYDDFERIYLQRPLEISLRMSVGAKKAVFEQRNGIPGASPGDKSYQVPEYSPDFHTQGSTRPIVRFGGLLKYVPDTFVPLQDLPSRPRTTFEERQKRKAKREEIEEVKNLDNWQPADLLTPVLQLPESHG